MSLPVFYISHGGGAAEGEKTKVIYKEKMKVWNFTSSSFQFHPLFIAARIIGHRCSYNYGRLLHQDFE